MLQYEVQFAKVLDYVTDQDTGEVMKKMKTEKSYFIGDNSYEILKTIEKYMNRLNDGSELVSVRQTYIDIIHC